MKPSQPSESSSAQYAITLKRLEAIKNQTKHPEKQRLKGKVCVITGVASKKGIGRATALLFARHGPKALYLLDFDGSELPNVEAEVKQVSPDLKVVTIQGDAGDEPTIKDLCERVVREEGRMDVFFANAGIAPMNLLESTDEKAFMRTQKVNVFSCFLALKYASRAMKVLKPGEKDLTGGSIVMTASVAGMRYGAGFIDYSASKAAVINLAQTGANNLSGTSIRVNAIMPGLIESQMTSLLFENARDRGSEGKIGQLNAMQRYGVPEEIASVALFLSSDESSYVNGAGIPVDGGLSSSLPVAGLNKMT